MALHQKHLTYPKTPSNMAMLLLTLLILTFAFTTGSSETCKTDEFKCIKSGRCIQNKFKCDGYFDCTDKSDESNCPADSCSLKTGVFRCKTQNNSCIPLQFKCDGLPDCKDQSDEEDCETTKCPTSMYTCLTSRKCIHKEWRCDNQTDCPDGSDEKNCSKVVVTDTSSITCHQDNQFECANTQIKQCINKKWFCDGHEDCFDGSDEPKGCTPQRCDEKTQFTCRDNSCILKSFVCDGTDDCDDVATQQSDSTGDVTSLLSGKSSDEDESVCPTRCKEGEFQCKETKACIPIDKLCDFKADCLDKSDEASFCRNYCKVKCPADSRCQPTPSGSTCICNNKGYRYKDGKCRDINECEENPSACQHICKNTEGSYYCKCVSDDYQLEKGSACRFKNGDQDDLLFVDVKDIHRYSLRDNYMYELISNLVRGVALDYDLRAGRVFYSDVTNNAIYSSYVQRNQKNVTKADTIIDKGLAVPDGIAVDWIAKNVYFTESSANRVDVSTFDGKRRASLISSNVTSPRGLVLDPRFGYLFITDWGGQARILRTQMDGSNMKTLVTEKIGWPNGITVDYSTLRVYWIDARFDYIDSIDYDGGDRRTLIKSKSYVPHPFALTMDDRYVYFTDWMKKGVVRVSKTEGLKDYSVLIHNLTRPMDIHVMSESRQPNASNPCVTNNPGCVHMCVIKDNVTASCLCQIGHVLERNGKSCRPVDKFLIFARSWQVRGISLDLSYRHDVMTPVLGLSSAVGTDFYAQDEYVFFSDIKTDRIGRVSIANQSSLRWLHTKNLENPDGLAVDWIGKNLYWTDTKVNAPSEIAVSKLDGKHRRTLYSGNLGKPRAIVVDPNRGYLFYTDWLEPARIGRLDMDGRNQKILVNGQNISWPNGLAIDKTRLYWADAKFDRIESINFEGGDRRLVIPSTQHPFGLAVDNDYIYWSDWLAKSIHRVPKMEKIKSNTTKAHEYLRQDFSGLMEIQIYDKDLQKVNKTLRNQTICHVLGCKQLCLLRPNNKAVCACAQNMNISRVDNKSCINIANHTSPKPFQCYLPGYTKCETDDKCIKNSWICDGFKDCKDGSDESPAKCHGRKCKEGEFKCNNSYRCIPHEWTCDSTNDCTDGSDEANCKTKGSVTCTNSKDFRCKDGRQCLNRRYQCDGEKDCEDNSDENGCDKPNRCDELLEFQCKTQGTEYGNPRDYGPCIPLAWICDQNKDCLDESDESPEICANKTLHRVAKGYKRCANGQLLRETFWCDQIDDCGDGSDEKCGKHVNYCEPIIFANASKKYQIPTVNCTCHENEFQCKDSKRCVKMRARCDLEKDCDDFSDEDNCPQKCSLSQFECLNHNCVDIRHQCDGKDDCKDANDGKQSSDEIGCRDVKKECIVGRDFFCDDSQESCIHLSMACNREYNCPNSTDEGPGCKLSTCQVNNGGCQQLCYTTPAGAMCGCQSGYRLSNDSQTCIDIDECAERSEQICTHECYNNKGSYSCKCVAGFRLRPDGHTCSASGPAPKVVFSDHKEIRILDPKTGEATTLVSGLKSAIGVDYHYAENRIYWSDVSKDKIERIFMNGTGREEVITQGMNSPEGLAIDWVANNIYWTDMRLDTIEAAHIDGQNRSVILSEGLDAPRALALDPVVGYMFWTDWGKQSRIERADMDGGNRLVLTNTNIVWPNGLTIDLATKKVYFVDARLDTLDAMSYEGLNRRTILKSGLIKHPFALAVFEDYAYFTDWTPGSIRRASRRDGSAKFIYNDQLKKPMGIQVMHQSQQPLKFRHVKNHCENSPCSHLCLLRPGGFSCKCPFGYQLKKDDNTSCISVEEFLIYARRQEIRGISLNPNDTVDKITPITGTQNAIGVDFHYAKQLIYWTDVSKDSISRISVQGNRREEIIPSGLPAPDGLAIDWIADNLYWTDADRDRIEVARLDGRYRKVIISSGMKQPRGIELVPQEGIMIWTDWGENKIEIARLDGSDRMDLVNDSIGYPNGVSYDFATRRVFWCDAKTDKIEYIELFPINGVKRRGVVNIPKGGIVHPFGITVFNGYIYWTDWGKRAILRTNMNGTEIIQMKSQLLSLMGLRIYHKDKQTGNNTCWNKTLCSHLCFALNSKDYRCGCATGFELDSDKRTCRGAKSFLLYSTTTEVRAMSFEKSPDSESIVPILGLKSSYGIDYHFRTGTIYIVDDNKDTVYRVKQDGSHLEPIVTKGLDRPQGIAVDWVAENLYWTDAGTHLIEVSRLNGSHRLILINAAIDSPRAIVVYPQKGYLFWTDWSSQDPKIERASLTGENRIVLVNKSILAAVADKKDSKDKKAQIGWPNGLTIDYDTDMMYWVDAKHDFVMEMDINGKKLAILVRDQKIRHPFAITHPYAITFFQGAVYWTDWQQKAVMKMVVKDKNKNITFIKRDLDNIRDLHAYDQSRQLEAKNHPCKDNNGGCEQLCLAYPSGKTLQRKCYCSSGTLASDGKSCEEVTDYLIFAKRNEIQFLDLNPRRRSSSPRKPIQSLYNAIGIDFDYESEMIYYSDIYSKEIGRIDINGQNKEVLVRNLKTPDGVAWDWVNKRLYWTDAEENTVNRLTGKVKEVLVHEELDAPRAIALSPCDGFMYWTDWGRRPYIKHATMDGFNPKAIVDTNLGWPNGLTVDMNTSRIYWADARLDRIESADFDGQNRKIIVQDAPHVFGVTMYGDFIYWTDWVTRSVMRINKNGYGAQVVLIDKLDAQPMGIKVYSKTRQNCSRTICHKDNVTCADICTVKAGKAVCSCGSGRTLVDGYRCVQPPKPGVVCKANSSFLCSDGLKCIMRPFVCDGDNDCKDKSDEEPITCKRHKCAINQFSCFASGKCIPEAWKCDNDRDCKDGSDEFNCPSKKNCTADEFRCTSGKCVARVFRCDGHDDCGDGSDEENCRQATCRPGYFKCEGTSECVHKSFVCDGYKDCSDGSDELKKNCIHVNCTNHEFKCADNKMCIPKTWYCDDAQDCTDGSDELHCNKTRVCNPTNDFTCKSGECIPSQFRCDGDKDCKDGSDEVSDNCNGRSCAANEFKCKTSSHCIPINYLCDGDDDCSDGSDEDPNHGCKIKTCNANEFRCTADRICIEKEWRCDGEKDCVDNSDEKNCPCEGTSKFKCGSGECLDASVKCNGKFDCKDKSDETNCEICSTYKCPINRTITCIEERHICNKSVNCDDYRDEKMCGRNECSESPKKCQQICVDLKQGYKCACHVGFFLQEDNRTCAHTCTDYSKHKCSQICIPSTDSNKTHICECANGYALEKNMVSCKHDTEVRPYLLLANKQFINKLSIHKQNPTYEIVYRTDRNVISLDWYKSRMYWLEGNGNGMQYSNINKPDAMSLIKNDIPNPLDLTVDWINGNVYFTESTKNTIFVVHLESKKRKTIVTDKTRPPNTIICHPSKGYLYYTTTEKKTKATISRVGMDGTKQKIFIDTNLKTPHGLTIDLVTETLYWSDMSLKRIEYVLLKNPGTRRVLLHTSGPAPAISIFEDDIYYSVTGPESAVYRAHRWTGENPTIIRKSKNFEKYTDLTVIHPLLQPRMKNPCSSSDCSHLCLLSPGGQYRCACEDHFTLAGSKACVNNCSSDQFQCPNYKCISRDWLCDKENDCGDTPASDEQNCDSFHCPADNFQCLNGNCTRKFFICDGEDDCGDNSDERNCENRQCFNFQFRCKNHLCIMRSRKCDGKYDCGNGDKSDEENGDCKSVRKCTKNQFQCDKDKCIPNAWKCDGTLDCDDKTDEANSTCFHHQCPKQHFKCNNGRCVMANWVCDGDDDCSDQSDEHQEQCRDHNCDPKSSFTCDKDQCKSNTWRCDGERDCIDGTDEENCKVTGCDDKDHFKCKNGNCIISKWRCDGDNDCGDYSDEDPLICGKIKCKQNEFKCGSSGTCIPIEWKCDKKADCADRSDEKYCRHEEQCSSDQFQCSNGTCVRLDWVCDGAEDCFDGTDESKDTCRYHTCNPDTHFECNHTCIPKYKRCDSIYKNCGHDSWVCERPCRANQFKCKYGECIDKSKVCDYSEDCSNGMDERNCVKMKNITCDKQCPGLKCDIINATQWLNCSCKEGYEFKFTDQGRECVDIDECKKSPQLCSQHCVNLFGSHKCKCANGYHHNSLGSKHCKVKGNAPLLVVPTEDNLLIASAYQIYNKTRPVTYRTELQSLLKNKKSMDFSYGIDRLLLFCDKNSIEAYTYAVSLFSTQQSERKRRESEPLYGHKPTFIIENIKPEHLRIDFVGRNLLWVDNSKTPSINIANMKGATRYQRTLISRNIGNMVINGMAIDPVKGFIYWTETYGNYIFPKIYKSQMNGKKITEFVVDKLEHPFCMVIDLPSGRLFWSDMKKHSIESVENENGTLRMVAIDSIKDNRLRFPTWIDVFENNVYGIMKYTGMLFKVHKFGRERMVILKADLRKTLPLRMYHYNKHLAPLDTFVNPCTGFGCPQICVNVNGKATCLCDQGEICEKEACDSKYCNDRGKCTNDVTSKQYTCQCDRRYFGSKCEDKCTYKCINGRCALNPNYISQVLYCRCEKGFTGKACENATCEDSNCPKNQKCYIANNTALCRCEGDDCKAATQSSDSKKTVIIAVIVVFFILLLLVVVVYIWIKRRREYNQFAPKRINIEMENPAFANEEIYNDFDDILPSKKSKIPDMYERTAIYNPRNVTEDDDEYDDVRETGAFGDDFSETAKLVDI